MFSTGWPRQPNNSSTVTGATSVTLSYVSNIYQSVAMTALGQSVIEADATTLAVLSASQCITRIVKNDGAYPIGYRDSTGTLLAAIAAGGILYATLKDNSTPAGSWSFTGSNLEPGLITGDSTFSSTYAATVIKPFVALDNYNSLHFAALASGFAVFAINAPAGGKAVTFGTPVTVDATASSLPLIAFKITSTTAMVFYNAGATNTLIGVVVTLSGVTTVAVGTPGSTLTATGCAIEDSLGAPKIIQLDTNLFQVTYATATGAGTTSVCGFQVSGGTTVNTGTPANIVATNNVINSTCSYTLTTTTSLVIYADDAAAPWSLNGVVISMTNANPPVPTVGTPSTVANVISTGTPPVSTCLLSPTKALALVDNNTTTAMVYVCSITAGTTATWGASLSVETGVTGFDSSNIATYGASVSITANRYVPKLYPTSASTALLTYPDSAAITRSVTLAESGGVVTNGAKNYKSVSWAAVNVIGFGSPVGMNSTDFLACYETLASTAGYGLQLLPSKISGTAITPGTSKSLRSLTPVSPASVIATRLTSGDYVIISVSASGSSTNTIAVVRSNGDYVNYRGDIACPLVGFSSAAGPSAVASNRVVMIGAMSFGTTVGVTTYQLRVINVEIAA